MLALSGRSVGLIVMRRRNIKVFCVFLLTMLFLVGGFVAVFGFGSSPLDVKVVRLVPVDNPYQSTLDLNSYYAEGWSVHLEVTNRTSTYTPLFDEFEVQAMIEGRWLRIEGLGYQFGSRLDAHSSREIVFDVPGTTQALRCLSYRKSLFERAYILFQFNLGQEYSRVLRWVLNRCSHKRPVTVIKILQLPSREQERSHHERVESNRRPACPLNAWRELGQAVCDLPPSSAAVAHAYHTPPHLKGIAASEQ